MRSTIALLCTFAIGLSACKPLTPTPVVLVDSFFSGYAFIDTNGNGQFDSSDAPLKDAVFIVQFEGSAQFGALTDETGNAFVTIPSSVQYPVTLFMKPPERSKLTLIGPSNITLEKTSGEKNSFLFTSD